MLSASALITRPLRSCRRYPSVSSTARTVANGTNKILRFASTGKPRYVGAIDQGTSSTRFMVFSSRGDVVAVHQEPHTQYSPQAGQSEHDPMELLDKTHKCVTHALTKANLTAADIAAIGITNQRETTVVWNKRTGKPYHNAIVWNDLRTTPWCDALAARLGGKDALRSTTGLPIAPYFSASKLLHLLDTEDGLRAAAEVSA